MTDHAAAMTPRTAFTTLAAALTIFFILAATASHGAFDAAEEAIMLWLRPDAENAGSGSAWLVNSMRTLTTLSAGTVVTAISIAVAVLLAARRQWGWLIVLLAAVIGEALITDFLKTLFDRERPDVLTHLVRVSNESFPSGHASSAAALYLPLGLLATKFAKRPAARAYILTGAVALVFLIGVSRVYLGVHYPSDVVAGWCVGAAWASAAWLAVERLGGRAGITL